MRDSPDGTSRPISCWRWRAASRSSIQTSAREDRSANVVRSSLLSITVGIAIACAPPAPRQITPADYPRTRPELTRYQETSHYADVRKFLDSLRTIGAPLTFGF